MTYEMVPFREEHVENAASLIAANYRVYRETQPALAKEWEDKEARAVAIRASLALGPGVVALRAGRLAGFLMSRVAPAVAAAPPAAPGSQPATRGGMGALRGMVDGSSLGTSVLGAAFQAADLKDSWTINRDMYAALSARLVVLGGFRHRVIVPVADKAAVETWFSLGFGLDGINGVREIGEIAAAPGEVSVRRAVPTDANAVSNLLLDLMRFHATAPIFWPLDGNYPIVRRTVELALADDTCPFWLGTSGTEALGLMSFLPSERSPPPFRADGGVSIAEAVTSPAARFNGVGTAILSHAFRWATEAGYKRCTVGWSSHNLVSSRFWTSRGFVPTFYQLGRQIDERIAWANERLSDDALWHRW